MSGLSKDQKRAKKKKPLSHGWIVVPSKSYRDRVYFYNVVTKCSTWINPCEVLDDETTSETSSDASVESANHKSPTVCPPKKQYSNENFSFFMKDNSEIEDYNEEQDHFNYAPINEFNLSHSKTNIHRNSPDFAFPSKTNKSDSDTSKNNMNLENNEKELWLHFASGPKKANWKKSLALSDFEQPSTSLGIKKEKQFSVEDLHDSDFKEPKIGEKLSKSRRKKEKKHSCKFDSGKYKKEDRRSGDKVQQNISFKAKDKTPAQTGMLKFRRDYAEKIKKLKNITTPFRSKPDKNKNYDASCPSSTTESLDYVYYHDHGKQDPEANIASQEDKLVLDNDEEMDWEPSSEESDVRNINEFRQQQDRNQTSSSISCELNGYHQSILPSQTQELVLVLDTNIFVSCLNFVKELRDTKIDSNYPIIYVPWRVLQELDHLKDSKINGANRQLSLNVRKAISFLNENFELKHPRIFGQSFENFNKMMNLNNFAADDEILHTCIQLKKSHSNIKLMLLTNDKNLQSKANVSEVKVFSKESFEKNYINLNSLSPNHSRISKVTSGSQPGLKIDNHVCEIKSLLKEFLSIIVETEMKVAFEEDWIRVIHKKPPWTTKEALTCFLKHWRSVFFLTFSKSTLNEAENLDKRLFVKEPANMEDVNEIISIFQRFIKSIISSQKKKRPYLDLTDGLMAKLSLLGETSLSGASQSDTQTSQAQFPIISTCDKSFPQEQLNTDDITPLDISKVKNLFRDIWESLRCFCCSMSDVVNSSNPGSNISLPELRLKLVQILNEVGELISSLEKIFAINLADINERHPLIIHFANFLSNLYPAISVDLQNKLPKCLAAFFTDFEGSLLLSRSLNDFREFSQELIKTSEFFKAHFL